MSEIWKKYRWYVIGALVAWALVTGWLLWATNAPQNAPFRYQVMAGQRVRPRATRPAAPAPITW